MFKTRIRLIESGWGSSAYYPSEVLERDGKKAFPKFTKILDTHILNNSKGKESAQGISIDSLVGHLNEDAVFVNGGLEADVVIYSDWADKVREKGWQMGMSVFSPYATTEAGVVEGRKGRVVKELHYTPFNTVDLVVFAGAKGRFITESATPCDTGVCEKSDNYDIFKAIYDGTLSVSLREMGGDNPDHGDNTMTIEEALASLKLKDAQISELSSELKSVKQDNLDLSKAISETLSAQAVTDQLDNYLDEKGMEFASVDIRGHVEAVLKAGVVFTNGQLDTKLLQEKVAEVNDGKDWLRPARSVPDLGHTLQESITVPSYQKVVRSPITDNQPATSQTKILEASNILGDLGVNFSELTF